MKRRNWKKGLAVLLGVILGVQLPVTPYVPAVSFAYTQQSATINATTLNVRSGAGTGYSSIAKLARGTSVTVIDETTGTDGKTWYQIRFTSGGTTQTGYVLGTYIHFAVTYQYDSSFEAQLSAQGFPESYKDGLRQLHAQFPNWVFEAKQTGLDWSEVISNEMVLPRSLIGTESISSYKSLADGAYDWDSSTWTGFDGSDWVAASEELLCYYMDPRNFLDEVFVFQFLSHQYDSSLQTKEGLQEMVKDTFLEGSVITAGSSSSSTTSSTTSSSSSSTSSSSSGVIIQGGSQPGSSTSSGGPGVTQANPGTSDSSSSSGVVVASPVASISRKDTALLMSSVTVGAMPGSGSSVSTSDSPSSGSSVIVQGSGSTVVSSDPGSTGAVSSDSGSTTVSYVDMIMQAAQESGVNPYVLAAMILQEQGYDGRGSSISGTVSGYYGYYNYFNVGAYASDGMTAIQRGMWYASQNDTYGRPWDTPQKSISGGAAFYGENYVSAGQDTFYLKKYNVQGRNMYKHQYMTNVDGAASEAALFAEAYSDNMRNSALRFQIPVYSNMPETACAIPTGDGCPNNKLKSLTVDGFTLTPTFGRDTTSYNLIVDQSVTQITVSASVINSTASVQGIGTIALAGNETDVTVAVTAQNGSVRNYTIHVVKQAGGPTYAGSADTTVTGDTGTSSSGQTTETSSGPGVSLGPGAGSSTTSGSGTSGVVSSDPVVGSNVTIIN